MFPPAQSWLLTDLYRTGVAAVLVIYVLVRVGESSLPSLVIMNGSLTNQVQAVLSTNKIEFFCKILAIMWSLSGDSLHPRLSTTRRPIERGNTCAHIEFDVPLARNQCRFALIYIGKTS